MTNPNSSIQIQYQFAALLNGPMKLRLIAQLKKPIMLQEYFVEDASDSGCPWIDRQAVRSYEHLCTGGRLPHRL
jgi:hypothetical protein